MSAVITLIMVVLACSVSVSAQGWQGIVPLHSSRSDVERLLGPPKGECRCFYMHGGDSIRVEYAKAPCVGHPSGWNVAPDTVLNIRIRWSQPKDFSSLQLPERKFQKTVDDTFTRYYSNRLEGLEYTVTWEGKVNNILYFPSSNDFRFRCPCLPREDESVARPIYFDEFAVRSVNNTLARLDNYVIELLNDPKWKGYVLLYAGRQTSSKQMADFKELIRRHLIGKRGLPSERLELVDGGYRENQEVELFMLSKGLPPPEPRGTWVPCAK